MSTLEDALAATLRELRQSRGLSQKEAATVLETKASTLARWETPGAQGRVPTPTTLAKLTAAYGTTPAALYASVDGAVKASVPNNLRDAAQKLGREINEREANANGNKD